MDNKLVTPAEALVCRANLMARRCEGSEESELFRQLAIHLSASLLATREACKERDSLNQQVVSLAVENALLKSDLMFWDADNPELPYDSPEEIASYCELSYNEELVVQVAAKLPNRTYRVCESWETDCKLELVEGTELQTPATDAAIANIQISGIEIFLDDNPAALGLGSIQNIRKNYLPKLRKESTHD